MWMYSLCCTVHRKVLLLLVIIVSVLAAVILINVTVWLLITQPGKQQGAAGDAATDGEAAEATTLLDISARALQPHPTIATTRILRSTCSSAGNKPPSHSKTNNSF